MSKLFADVARTLVPPRGDPHGPLPPLLVVLTVVTGVVDAVSYLALGHVFVANMTGNVVFLGFALAGASGLSAPPSLAAMSAFLLGALAGGRLARRFAARRGQLLALTTSLQTVLVVAAVLVSLAVHAKVTGGVQYTLIVLLGMGMGLQNAVVRGLGVPDLNTTVLTMTLTGLAADSAPAGGDDRHPGRRALSVLAMFTGAFLGAQLLLHTRLEAPLGLALLLLVGASATVLRLSRGAPGWLTPPG